MKLARLVPILLLAACTTSNVLTTGTVQSAMRNKGVYGVATFGDRDPVKIKGRQPGEFENHTLVFSHRMWLI